MKLRALLAAPARGAKALTSMVFSKASSWFFALPLDRFELTDEVGDPLASSTVAAPVLWVARTFPEAPPALWQQDPNGQEDQVRRHDLLRLLQRPNRFTTGPLLWMGTTIDWMVNGDSYWLKLRDKTGAVRELWWTPSWMLEPVGDDQDDSVFISHYEYRPSPTLEPIPIRVEDIVHFRFGVDPDNPRKGMSPLKSVLREVFTDEEAATFTASLLRNMGVPGVVVSPEKGATVSEADAKLVKAYINTKFTGENRGEPLVMSGATQVEQFGFNPEQLMLKDLRRIPEERVTAVLGIPAIVAGLGAGLDRSTFTNMAEAREAAYEAGIIPMQRILAEEVRFQLLTEFEDEAQVLDEWRFGFDLSKVRVLQEDLYRQAQRNDLGVRGGWVQVAEARRANGLEVDDSHRIFLRQMNLVQVPADGGKPTPLTPRGGGSSRAGDDVAGLIASTNALLAERNGDATSDPALIGAIYQLAQAAREPRPTDPELVELLHELANRDGGGQAYADALVGITVALEQAGNRDEEIVGALAALSERASQPKTVEWSEDHRSARVTSEPVGAEV